jgi:hypothetical protein
MIKKLAVAIIFLVLIMCAFWGVKDLRKVSNDLQLEKKDVTKIQISVFPPVFNTFNVTDKKQISSIVDCLTSLKLTKTDLKPQDYYGGEYSMKFKFKNDTERVISISSNMFIVEENKFKYKIDYKEDSEFEKVIGNILEENESKTDEHSIEGNIISIKSAKSGKNISCTIKDKSDMHVDIDVSKAKVIDASGSGWLILRKNDVIKAFYRKKSGTDNKTITALTVYIQRRI